MINKRVIDLHNHTDYSNLRLIDAINTHESLAERAQEIGLKGLVYTDHECLSASIKICEMREKYPNLKLGIGNEIYLVDQRGPKQHYYHFLLIAKDAIGHKQLRILSSESWLQAYSDRGLERVPTLKSEVEKIIKENPGHVIATTACLAGELSVDIEQLIEARKSGDNSTEALAYSKILSFLGWCKDVFNDDFYIEIPPGASKEQVEVNKKLYQIAHSQNIKIETSCDAHYERADKRNVHAAFLRSKDGERETDSFYHYSYLQSEEEILKHLGAAFGEDTERVYQECCDTAQEIFDKITEYDLRHPQRIPRVEVKDYPKKTPPLEFQKEYPILSSMFISDDKSERYWINQCQEALKEKNLQQPAYYKELEKEADIKRVVGARLKTNMFDYPITLQHYVDIFWEEGSTISAGRGSSSAGLNHYLMKITQTDPIALHQDLFERYMNKDTQGLGDIDLDLCPSVRPKIIQRIKEERGQNFNSDIKDFARKELGATLVATFGTASSRRAIQIACKGYKTKEYPDGIDDDTAKYLSSLIPSERGFTWPLRDAYYGNEAKGRRRLPSFVKEVDSFDGLLDIMLSVEGLIVSRGSHASGIIFQDEDPYEFCCYMKTPSGDIETQYDLESAEAAGLTKYDLK